MTKARKLIDGSAFDADTVAMMGERFSPRVIRRSAYLY